MIKSRQAVEEEIEKVRTSEKRVYKRQNPTNREVSSLGLPRQVQNIVDQDLVRVFKLLSKWDWEANRSV